MKKLVYIQIMICFFTEIVSGQSFDKKTISDNRLCQSVYFTGNNTGYICGNSGMLLKTTNGGDSWAMPDTNMAMFDLFGIAFQSNSTGFAIGSNSILKTTNSGEVWKLSGAEWDVTFSEIKQLPNSGVYVSGFYNNVDYFNFLVIRSTNEGLSWDTLYNDTLVSEVRSILPVSSGSLFIAGDKGIIYTQNSGASWQFAQGINHPISTVFIKDNDEWYAVGGASEGVIYKSVNAGQNWTQLSLSSTGYTGFKQIVFNDSRNKFFVSDKAGKLYSFTESNGVCTLTEFDLEGKKLMVINNYSGREVVFTDTNNNLYK